MSGLLLAALGVLLLTDNLHVLSTWFSDLLDALGLGRLSTGLDRPGDRPGWHWRPWSRYRCGGVMDPVIRFRSAVALVGRFPVLAGVDLDVAAGEIVLLQGANGAGKTSLLRACAGLLRVVGRRGHRPRRRPGRRSAERSDGGSACSVTPPPSTTI